MGLRSSFSALLVFVALASGDFAIDTVKRFQDTISQTRNATLVSNFFSEDSRITFISHRVGVQHLKGRAEIEKSFSSYFGFLTSVQEGFLSGFAENCRDGLCVLGYIKFELVQSKHDLRFCFKAVSNNVTVSIKDGKFVEYTSLTSDLSNCNPLGPKNSSFQQTLELLEQFDELEQNSDIKGIAGLLDSNVILTIANETYVGSAEVLGFLSKNLNPKLVLASSYTVSARFGARVKLDSAKSKYIWTGFECDDSNLIKKINIIN